MHWVHSTRPAWLQLRFEYVGNSNIKWTTLWASQIGPDFLWYPSRIARYKGISLTGMWTFWAKYLCDRNLLRQRERERERERARERERLGRPLRVWVAGSRPGAHTLSSSSLVLGGGGTNSFPPGFPFSFHSTCERRLCQLIDTPVLIHRYAGIISSIRWYQSIDTLVLVHRYAGINSSSCVRRWYIFLEELVLIH